MKLLSLAVVLLVSPFVHTLANHDDNGGKDTHVSYLESPAIDSRSSSGADAQGITAVRFVTDEKEISKRGDPCTKIWWSNSPDNVQEGVNYNTCIIPELCYKIKQPWIGGIPGGLSSIHFDEKAFACDIWAMPNCQDIGGNSHHRLTQSSSDLTSLMKMGNNDGRAKSFACSRKNAGEKREAPPVVKSTEIKEISKRGSDICIDFCDKPDSSPDRVCHNNNCAPPGQCMNTVSQVVSGMGSIHFGDGINCDVYRAYDCKINGRNSHSQIRGGMSDLTGLLQGLGHSYKCELASNKEKRAVEARKEEMGAIKARTNPTPSIAARQEDEQLGTCVDFCSEHDFKGKCTCDHCTAAAECVTADDGVDSIKFSGATYCALFTSYNCKQLGGRGEIIAEETVKWVSNWAMWSGKAHSFMCQRPYKRSLNSVDPKPAFTVSKVEKRGRSKSAPAVVAAPENEKRQEFGTCVDHCTGPNFTGKCTRNHCTAPKECVSVSDGGIGSISFAGATHCSLYLLENCDSSGSAMPTSVNQTIKDVKAYAGWQLNTAKSFRCVRPYKKREIQPVDSAPTAAAAEVAVRNVATPPYPSCVDYCEGEDFTGTCTKKVCTKDLQCVNTPFGFNSIKFSGTSYCYISIKPDCDPDGAFVTGESMNNIQLDAGWKPDIASSFKCHRLD